MTTALDTNVLLDVLSSSPDFGDRSADALAKAGREGALIVCEVVYAELSAAFRGDRDRVDAFFRDLGIGLVASGRQVLVEAGRIWRAYRDTGGPRERIVTDFLVGAHARHHAAKLLTRDRGFYRRGFDGLKVDDPTMA